uniref:AAA+ ATPase domain-containing protein n=1 Tax=Skeletonema marinoi TaxID=267567 RepID=A0A7S2KQ23_9STRA|mmetsp:Transcript_15122/g.25521  ORF Transcript_15122/g.25521 Transcript_15122/m.25521 type:complete len:990 (+) Transcript_15122:128-3097(+)
MTNQRVKIISMLPMMLLTTAAAWSSFHGSRIIHPMTQSSRPLTSGASSLVMRKQKASDKRTARLQRGQLDNDSFTPPPLSISSSTTQILSSTPMSKTQWKHKKIELRSRGEKVDNSMMSGGRGRARKRLKLYNSLASYHSTFSNLISEEYQVEEAEVIQRLEASIGDPFSLEEAGHAIFDVHPQRRGNLFNDEVYRLEKSLDATTTYFQSDDSPVDTRGRPSPLPANHKFSANDVIVITLQPRGTGDFLGVSSLPTNKDAVLVEARVLNIGPSYVDVAIPAGRFSTAFGPASNNVGDEGKGDPSLRVRVDRFFSDVPFKRMAAALGQLTSVPQQNGEVPVSNPKFDKRVGGFQMDNLLKEAILSTFAIKDETNILLDGIENPSLGDLPKKLAKPPLPASIQWADQVMAYIKANPSQLFPVYNEPQLTAIRSALTRRLTLIQGPPGTGKTTVAGSVAFGFVHQCRKISPHCKVLATAFSNVGADNMAEKFLSLGLKVVRVGKPSGVSESLWSYTLDAAIQRDPNAQHAMNVAAKVSAKVKKQSTDTKSRRRSKQSPSAERAKRDAVTQAVKDSIQACNIAATRALREADVIVSTSVGAADAQLLAACGIYPEEDEQDSKKKSNNMQDSTTLFGTIREFAPDNLPPLSLPFVIIDEACQSVEPASLIPIVSTNSCRSLVMLGDPCQLPPTVRSDKSSTGESPLSISLMSRLASIMPQPVTVTAQKDSTPLETKFIQCKPTRQAVSRVNGSSENISYRKRFSGSLLLSVQYRMHPSIAAFSSAVFYNELLTSPSTLTKMRQFPSHLNAKYPATDTSVRFIRVGGRDNEAKGEISESGSGLLGSSSYRNHAEAEAVVELLRSLLAKDTGFDGSVGIVTPYSAQVALIKTLMARDDEFRSLAQSFPHEIEVKSVDAYQGRERDLIIFSAVRSNRHGRVGFLADWRRMNVALTRAKNGLVVVGDADTLKEGDKHWDAFVSWCENMDCLVENTKQV